MGGDDPGFAEEDEGDAPIELIEEDADDEADDHPAPDNDEHGYRPVRARDRRPRPGPLRRHRRKGPEYYTEAVHEAWMLKKAKTKQSLEKQLEKEIPWRLIPADKREAFQEAESKQWAEHLDHKAIEVLDVATSRAVQERVDPRRILPSRYAYKDKNLGRRRVDPTVPWRPKARLVVGGHVDPDVEEVKKYADSPTVSRAALMLVLQIATSRQWQAAAGDVQAAFLNGLEIKRELFMHQPRDGVPGLLPNQIIRICKGVFGLTESPKMWYERLVQVITDETFFLGDKNYFLEPSALDPCVFMLLEKKGDTPAGYVTIHVDDLLVTAPAQLNKELRECLSRLFPVDGWEVGSFDYIGSHIDMQEEKTTVTQTSFVDGRLFTIDIPKELPDDTPADEEMKIDNRSLIGALSWLAGQTRPDLQCGVALAQQLQRCPTVGDVRFTNSLARKAEKHRENGITLWPIDLSKASLVVFHDAAWANAGLDEPEEGFELTPSDLEAGTMKEGPYSGDRHRRAKRTRSRVASQLGHLIFLGEIKEEENVGTHLSLLEWRSQACQRVCRSTFGAETMSCVEGLENAQYIRALLASLLEGKLVKLEEARGTLNLLCLSDCKSLTEHLHRTGVPRVPTDRRLAIDLAALRQELRAERRHGRYPVAWIPTSTQLADPLTKPMQTTSWWEVLRGKIGIPWKEGTRF